jgi:two-component system phosphate regulon sensor histidine kinase PhoR
MAFLGVVVAALLPAAFMLDRWIGDGVRDLVRDSLMREAQALAAALERAQPADVQDWVAHQSASVRVTVIDADGTVRGDSELPAAALASVENHAGRPEVRAALSGHVGVDARRSSTVGRKLL